MAATPGDIRSTIVGWQTLRREHTEHSPRILVASSFTAQPIAPGLGTAWHRSSGRVATIEFLDYNQLFQLCLDPGRYAAETFDEIVIMWRLEDVFERDVHDGAPATPTPCNGSSTAPPRSVPPCRSLPGSYPPRWWCPTRRHRSDSDSTTTIHIC